MADLLNLTGQRFGRLTVAHRIERERGQAWWHCKCDCGREKAVASQYLRSGVCRNCGCEHHRTGPTTHGASHTREYRAWCQAKARCFNSKRHDFANYGGRGITMCPRWVRSFPVFFRYMGLCPDGRSLDRENVNGNYEPGNCRWATRQEQARNTRRTKTFQGESLSAPEWGVRFNLTANLIRLRLSRGWTIERTLTTPARPPRYKKQTRIAA